MHAHVGKTQISVVIFKLAETEHEDLFRYTQHFNLSFLKSFMFNEKLVEEERQWVDGIVKVALR